MAAIAILAVLLSELHESQGTGFLVATTDRDQLRAEYLAKSGVNLTRLLVGREPQIRAVVNIPYQALMKRPAPQLPVWRFANEMLQPFCNYDQAVETARGSGIDLAAAEGLGSTGGTCEIVSLAENSKINVNDPLNLDGDTARSSVAMQLFALVGGYHSPSPYDPLFEQRDADGQFTSRLDVVTGVIDWWDRDQNRTIFDPGAGTVSSAGGEDDVYSLFRDRYEVKNAPMDSNEELRMVRGVGDDFWATFVEPDPDDPDSRNITVYGSGAVNPNEARPEVLLARVCSFLGQSLPPLCADAGEQAKFIQLLNTVRSILPIPWFTLVRDFLNFLEGRGGEYDLYPVLQSMLGPEHPLLFMPISIPPDQRGPINNAFVTAARILTIQVDAEVGRARTRIRTVANFHDRWTPPPPNSGQMPGLGIFHYYRIE